MIEARPDLEVAPGRYVGTDRPCFIIAEIGQNHQGDVQIAKELIRVAKECGADCIKFQKSCLTEKFTRGALDRDYAGEHSWGATYGQHKERLEFDKSQYLELQQYAADQVGIPLTASAMDPVSLDFLDSIGVPFIKIGSGDADNEILLRRAALTGKPLIISTGMSDMDTVDRIYATVSKRHKKFAMLHCISAYPTPPQSANLRVIETYLRRFPDVQIGYSGHELGYAITLAAVALGAKVVERHITLDKRWKGSDHRCSLEPQEFSAMVKALRDVEAALGTPVKCVQPCELECRRKLGKSLVVAAQSIPGGRTIGQDDVNIKVSEPPGLPAARLRSIIGKAKTVRMLSYDEPIQESDISYDLNS
ncbi:hypothetical protein AAG570_003332 [Ranatra chinensis]|uniref:N-acetylneuraminate-9-phosphate synthase n=1 Tax=Ranatra chinensis TaxID=642074 RepID=A0ABD0YT86_9HEMI